MDGPKVVQLRKPEDWRDAVATLEQLVAALKSGELAAISIGGMVLIDVNGDMEVFGFGPKADSLELLAAFVLAQTRVQDNILGD